MCTLQNLLICCLTLVLTRLVGVQPLPVTSIFQAQNYLSQYGYLNKSDNNSNILDFSTFTEALKEFQRFFGLSATGKINVETLKLMSLQRCGENDKMTDANGQQLAPFAIQGSAWGSKSLTIRVANYPNGSSYPPDIIDSQFLEAFKMWCVEIDRNCTLIKSGTATILMSFYSFDHGCGASFDGPGGTLAHAYFPQYGGAAHFDGSEHWTVASTVGINLLQTATHELGHSMGLLHSGDKDAIMYPIYRGYNPNFELAYDDIKGIKYLYLGEYD